MNSPALYHGGARFERREADGIASGTRGKSFSLRSLEQLALRNDAYDNVTKAETGRRIFFFASPFFSFPPIVYNSMLTVCLCGCVSCFLVEQI